MEFLRNLSLLLLVLGYFGSAFSDVHCSCVYRNGGCVIAVPAPKGFKCKCYYVGAWICKGSPFPCVGEENCHDNLADFCACKLGGGDCGGYTKPQETCDYDEEPRTGVVGNGDCDCGYHPGGCHIYDAAPFGWRCVCVYMGAWRCYGWAQQCARNEICLGDNFSFCGCMQGGGDCGGYPDRPSCPVPFLPMTCNCESQSAWSKGLYTIDDIIYDTTNITMHSLQVITLAKKEIPNYSGSTQFITLTIGEKLTKTSFFTNTSGIAIHMGTAFKVGIPSLSDVGSHVSVTGGWEHTWGQSESIEPMFKGEFTCNGAPHKYTKCSVTMKKAMVTIPYVMRVRHTVIPNCVCESFGVWSGTQAFNAKLISTEAGDCIKSDCSTQFRSSVWLPILMIILITNSV